MTQVLGQTAEQSSPKTIAFLPKQNNPYVTAAMDNVLKRSSLASSSKNSIQAIHSKEEKEKTSEEKTLCAKIVDIITWIPAKFIQIMKRIFSGFTSVKENEAAAHAQPSNRLLGRFSYQKPASAPVAKNVEAPVGLKGKMQDAAKRFGHFVSSRAKAGYEEAKYAIDGGLFNRHEVHFFKEGARIAAGQGAITEAQLNQLSESDHVALLEGAFCFEGLRQQREALDSKATCNEQAFNDVLEVLKQSNSMCANLNNDANKAQWKQAFELGKLLASEVQIIHCGKGTDTECYKVSIAPQATLSPALRQNLMEVACEGKLNTSKDPLDILSGLMGHYASTADYSLNLRKSIEEAEKFHAICQKTGATKRQEALVSFFHGLVDPKTSVNPLTRYISQSWSTSDALRNANVPANNKLPKQYMAELENNTEAQKVFGAGIAKYNLGFGNMPKVVQDVVKTPYVQEEERVGNMLDHFAKAAFNGTNYFDPKASFKDQEKEIQRFVKEQPELTQQTACDFLAQQMLAGKERDVVYQIYQRDLAPKLGLQEEQALAIVNGFHTLQNAGLVFKQTDKGTLRLVKADDLKQVKNAKELEKLAPQVAKELVGLVAFDLAAAGVSAKLFNLESFFDAKVVDTQEIAKMTQAGEAFKAAVDGQATPKDCKGLMLECYEAGKKVRLANLAQVAYKTDLPAQKVAIEKAIDTLAAQKRTVVADGDASGQIDTKIAELKTKLAEIAPKIAHFQAKSQEYFTEALAFAFVEKTTTIKEAAHKLELADMETVYEGKSLEKEFQARLQAAKPKNKQTSSEALFAVAVEFGKTHTREEVDALRASESFVAMLHKNFKADAKRIFLSLERGSLFKEWSEKADQATVQFDTPANRQRLKARFESFYSLSEQDSQNLNVNNREHDKYLESKALIDIWQQKSQAMNEQQKIACWQELLNGKINETINKQIFQALEAAGLDNPEITRLGFHGVLGLVERKVHFDRGAEENLPLYKALTSRADVKKYYTAGLVQSLALGVCANKAHGHKITGNAIFNSTENLTMAAVQDAFSNHPQAIWALNDIQIYADFIAGDFDRLPAGREGTLRFVDKLIEARTEDLHPDLAVIVAHKEKMLTPGTTGNKHRELHLFATACNETFKHRKNANNFWEFPEHYTANLGEEIAENIGVGLISKQEAEYLALQAYKSSVKAYKDMANTRQLARGHDVAAVDVRYQAVIANEATITAEMTAELNRKSIRDEAYLEAQAKRLKVRPTDAFDKGLKVAGTVFDAAWGAVKGAAERIRGSETVANIRNWIDEDHLLNGYVQLSMRGAPFHDQDLFDDWLKEQELNDSEKFGFNPRERLTPEQLESKIRAVFAFVQQNPGKAQEKAQQYIQGLVLFPDLQEQFQELMNVGGNFDIDNLANHFSACFGNFNGQLNSMIDDAKSLEIFAGKFTRDNGKIKLLPNHVLSLPVGSVVNAVDQRILKEGCTIKKIVQILSAAPTGSIIVEPTHNRNLALQINGWDNLPSDITLQNWPQFLEVFVENFSANNFFDKEKVAKSRPSLEQHYGFTALHALDFIAARLQEPHSVKYLKMQRGQALLRQFADKASEATRIGRSFDGKQAVEDAFRQEKHYGLTKQDVQCALPVPPMAPIVDGLLPQQGYFDEYMEFFIKTFPGLDFATPSDSQHLAYIKIIQEQNHPIIGKRLEEINNDLQINANLWADFRVRYVEKMADDIIISICQANSNWSNRQVIDEFDIRLLSQLSTEFGGVCLSDHLQLKKDELEALVARVKQKHAFPAGWQDNMDTQESYQYFVDTLGVKFLDNENKLTITFINTWVKKNRNRFADSVVKAIYDCYEEIEAGLKKDPNILKEWAKKD